MDLQASVQLSAIPRLCKQYEDCKLNQGANSHAALFCLRALAHEHRMTGNKADLEEAARHLSSALQVCTGQHIGWGLSEDLAMRVGIMYELADAQIRLDR